MTFILLALLTSSFFPFDSFFKPIWYYNILYSLDVALDTFWEQGEL